MDNLQSRLRSLPPKVAIPFQKLLAAGQLNDQILEDVLDAGRLAGDSSKLIGFTAGMLFMQSQGVPVHDTIAMAKKQGRKINLAWSASRWKSEHDRLSRAEALARLSQEHVAYDVSKFATALPEQFPGYLIRNSRQLGREGLRQRHCVASYHERLQAGECAIAAVFVNKQRWTVQLMATGKEDAPLRIVQIKTRYNVEAPKAVKEVIHRLLGVKYQREVSPANAAAPEGNSYMDNLRAALPVLREHGVESVTVNFDGCGDSGQIDGASYFPEIDPQGITVPVRQGIREFVDGAWIMRYETQALELEDAIQAIAEDYLDETNVNYSDGEGGWGELSIDVAQGTVSLEVNVRYVESNTEFSSKRSIETGEEVD